MTQAQIIEGTGEELQQHLKQQPKNRFRLILLPANTEHTEPVQGTGLHRGMFPQLRGLTEEDFKVAE